MSVGQVSAYQIAASAFATASIREAANRTTLIAEEVVGRVQQQAYNHTPTIGIFGTSAVSQKLNAARTAGSEALASLGFDVGPLASYTAPAAAASQYSSISISASETTVSQTA
jgi:hypothetical protein